jgi:hypothetical protein
MSLSTLYGIATTGSIVFLSDKFVDWISHLPHNIQEGAFWSGEFRLNVIPLPCKGEEVKEYRVEFTEYPEERERKGFAIQMYPDNTMVNVGGWYSPPPGMQVIGEIVS